jgi:predicted AlkP superfamily pyrophosphatase or phosphodiesterase
MNSTRLVNFACRCALLLSFGFWMPALAAPAVRHVLVIGCDGFGSQGILPTNTPVLHQLMRAGSYTLRARAVMPTSSSPNWASMLMGAGPEQHGITSNHWQTNKFDIAPTVRGSAGFFPTIFGVLREQRPAFKLGCIYDWSEFGRLIEPRAPNILENVQGTPNTVRRAREVILKDNPEFLFLHFDAIDHAGHTSGYKSAEYFKTVDEVDAFIGDLLNALSGAGTREQTVVLVTADHGGKGKSHGGESMDEIEIPWLISGPGIRRGYEIKAPVDIYDTAATIARLFGVTPPQGWIAKPVKEAFE